MTHEPQISPARMLACCSNYTGVELTMYSFTQTIAAFVPDPFTGRDSVWSLP